MIEEALKMPSSIGNFPFSRKGVGTGFCDQRRPCGVPCFIFFLSPFVIRFMQPYKKSPEIWQKFDRDGAEKPANALDNRPVLC
ncbi:MAG: hypothetical protein IJK40_08160 [Clostridia bacterium]|nr:hypothetical protein [Clostridia bacterium]MBR0538110.1 hypothetical protein [Clostridia bacterium]